MHSILLLNIAICFLCSTSASKILGVFHAPSFSHQILGHALFEGLANKGHEITLITPTPPKNEHKNIKIIKLEYDFTQDEAVKSKMFEIASLGVVSKLLIMETKGLMFADLALNQTAVQDILKSDVTFDAVIIENFMNDAFKGFCYRFKAPCIMFSTIGTSRWTNGQMGNPGSPSYIPDLLVSLPKKMNFFQRAYNTLVYSGAELLYHLYGYHKQNELLQKYFSGAPHLDELQYNISLMLLNSHVSTHPAVPLVPNMIEVGGIHVKPSKKLPDDLQDYLDNSKNGAIFFSLGSNLRSKDLPKEKLDIMLNCFARLKENVLWKWESESMPGQPANVKLGKWLPQQDILAHPNIKLFVSHGGLLSLTETLYHGIPVVGIPIFGDQEMNIASAEYGGYGLSAPYTSLHKDTFCKTIKEALSNPKYTKNAKQRSKIMHDQPQKPLDRGIFWVEYVIRHKGAPHLRTAALNLKWYQYLLLDVISFYILTTLVAFYAIIKTIKKLFCKKCRTKQDKDKKIK